MMRAVGTGKHHHCWEQSWASAVTKIPGSIPKNNVMVTIIDSFITAHYIIA